MNYHYLIVIYRMPAHLSMKVFVSEHLVSWYNMDWIEVRFIKIFIK